MANIMSMVKLQNKPSRNAFDLSRKVAFSAKVAELLPVECIECLPGDKFKVRKQHFTRTLPVNTAAYTRIREYYDWFFVPTNLLWNKFNTFVTQMSDNNQKAQSITDASSTGTLHPWFSTQQIGNYLQRFSSGNQAQYVNNFFGYNRPMLSAKLLDYLGYGAFYNCAIPNYSTKYPAVTSLLSSDYAKAENPFPLLAYQKIYQDYYRNSQWEKAYAPACNIDYMNDKDSMQLPIEQVDYTSENMFDLRYCNWNKDYFMGVLPNSQYGDAASVDLEGLSNTSFGPTSETTILIGSPSISETEGFNSSQVGLSPKPSDSSAHSQANSLLSANSTLSGRNNHWLLSSGAVSAIRNAMNLSSSGSLQSAFTILQLRQAEAAQKWKEITQSAQQDYKAQIEAHFGVNVSDAYSDRCKFVDGSVNTIDINEVVNQSLNGADTAEIKGKGVGTGDGSFTFETKVHGYLMCIYHAIPLLDFQLTGIKRTNTKVNVTDYAIPEFDKTGMIKIHASELFTELAPFSSGNREFLLGYAPQYYEYKTQYDEVKGAFAYGGLESWVSPLTYKYVDEYVDAIYDQFGQTFIEYHFFKVNPSVMNPIFVKQLTAEDLSSAELESDQLLINCSFDVKAVRNLDRNGLPY